MLNNKQTHTERYVENILAVRVQPVIKTQWVLCGMFESTLSAYLSVSPVDPGCTGNCHNG